jgi:hypothetical protein
VARSAKSRSANPAAASVGGPRLSYGTLDAVTAGLIIIGRRVGTRQWTLLIGLRPISQ